jgi:hypothetical protein
MGESSVNFLEALSEADKNKEQSFFRPVRMIGTGEAFGIRTMGLSHYPDKISALGGRQMIFTPTITDLLGEWEIITRENLVKEAKKKKR